MRPMLLAAALTAAALVPLSLSRAAEDKPVKTAAKPAVGGEWTGTWGVYSPPKPGESAAKPNPYAQAQMRLDCKVKEAKGDKWEATFEGECGRPYKYTVKMLGRQAGDSVLFSGTADLGEKDGGVYDWIGRATDKEFVGFYTSAKYTGTFRLERPAAK